MSLGEKKELAAEYIGKGLKRDQALSALGISKNQYYYRPKGIHPGRQPSEITLRKTSEEVIECSNMEVISDIRNVKSDPDTNYGYRKMCYALKLKGYFINHKKTYRLMKEAFLLGKRYVRTGKKYARYRIVIPENPLEVLEMDIKYVWIEKHRQSAFILTVLDTFTRAVLSWKVGYSMRQSQVKQAWEQVITQYLQPADILKKGVHVEVRNDNGPQFAAKEVQKFFRENYLDQVFTHPYTPQENGHVESFHKILSDSIGKEHFWELEDLQRRLQRFYDTYNYVRIHSSVAQLPPMTFWELWDDQKLNRVVSSRKKVKFKLQIPYQDVLIKTSGNRSQREVSCSNPTKEDLNLKEVNGPETLQTTSVQKSPSVVSC